MSCFIAFDIPKEKYIYLENLQKKIRKFCSAKFQKKKNFHLTLKFLGDINEKQVNQIKTALNEVKHEQFTAELSNLGVFPSANSPQVIWIGLEPQNIICELQQKIDKSLKQLFESSDRFVPHITLARIKQIENKIQLRDMLQSKQKPISFNVSSFILYKSQSSSKGSVYIKLNEYKLENNPIQK